MKMRVGDLFQGTLFRTLHTDKVGKVGEPTPEGVVAVLEEDEKKTLHRDVLVWVDFQ